MPERVIFGKYATWVVNDLFDSRLFAIECIISLHFVLNVFAFLLVVLVYFRTFLNVLIVQFLPLLDGVLAVQVAAGVLHELVV